jgi:hypothetical protein
MSDQTTYPLCQRFSIGFSAYEDRLLLTTELAQTGHTTLLLTRRMVLLTLQQILNKLPALTGLEQTPVAYWQEVLQLAHQQALQRPVVETEAQPDDSGDTEDTDADHPDLSEGQDNIESQQKQPTRLYLATELTTQLDSDRLKLAFKGLPVLDAMQTPCPHVPVLAVSLEANHVHQVIQLLITQATNAMWHLPVELPWLETPSEAPVTQTLSH